MLGEGLAAAARRGACSIFLILACLFIAAVVVAVAIATSTSNNVVHLRTVVGHDAQNVIDQVKNLVNQNTK